MKTKLFFLISIIVTILSCQNSNFKPEGKWIGVYSLLDKSSPLYEVEKEFLDDTIRVNRILSFEEDSMVLTSFNETVYYGFNQYKLGIILERDSIRIRYEGEEGAWRYLYDSEFLNLDIRKDEGIKYDDYYTKIDEYGMVHKEEALDSFLTSNPIVLGQKTDRIELFPSDWYHMGNFIQDSLEVDYGSGDDWYFCSIDKELFLIIGENLIHVKEFENEIIYGVTYFKNASNIEIKKYNYNNSFNNKLLLGNWIREKEDNQPNIDSTAIKDMKISDEQIILDAESYSDTLDWDLNKYGNKVLIKKDNNDRHGEYWKIQKLSKNELVLKRKVGRIKPKIEILNFKRN